MLPEVVEELYKISSVNLCPNLPGQFATALMVDPPKPGDISHELFDRERSERVESLKRRARMLSEAFNRLDGVSCQPTEGAMYAFPRINLPAKAVEEAKRLGKQADVLYCLELLNETGLCCVPGSGFQQAPGTFHFRTTILVRKLRFMFFVCCFTLYLLVIRCVDSLLRTNSPKSSKSFLLSTKSLCSKYSQKLFFITIFSYFF